MKHPRDLSKAQATQILVFIQNYLYADDFSSDQFFGGKGGPVWNPDVEINGGDFLDELAHRLDAHGLVPHKVMPRK